MITICPPLNDATIKSMKGNKCKDTKPEMILRKGLREARCQGYRLQWNVSGHPDICYPGKKVAIFVNGCFWHRCPRCDLPLPEHNHDYWMQKFEANIARDAKKTADLETLGWKVITVWECEIKKDLPLVVSRITAELHHFDHKV